ncbi:MAG: hypothetical protein GKR90_15405 [Pseudomonadales bacterium]|nr:hypothetical protein [Pseudomonadales bacterium]
MFKNLFNNPWFIGALGVCASIYLGWAIAKPIFFDDNIEVVQDTVEQSDDSDGSEAFADEDSEAYDTYGDEYDQDDEDGDIVARRTPVDRSAVIQERGHIGWLDDIERDPFANSPLAVQNAGNAELPTLEALFLSDGVQAAVIENRLVHVGDTVAHFRITEIGENFVRVSRYGRHFRLEPKAG